MAWRSDYGRDYNASWYNRGARRDFEPGWQSNSRWESGYGAGPRYGRDYSYDNQFRQPPQQSPAYGRGGDREVQQWARHHGYDAGFQIRPDESGPPRQYNRPPDSYNSGMYGRNQQDDWGWRDQWERNQWDRPRNARGSSDGYRW